MNELNDTHEKDPSQRIREILKELTESKGLKKNKIANYLELDEKQFWAFYKFINGDPLPKYLEPITGKILVKLKLLLENPDLLKKKETVAENDIIGYDIAPRSPFVWIPFDKQLPTIEYNGINPPLSVIQMGEKKGVVAFRHNSKHVADGEIFIDHIGMATEIEPGTKLTIRRIDKRDWKTDRYYVIIDASGQISIWELLPGDDEKTVRFVSTRTPDGPHMLLPLERIEVIFSIIDGNCIPKPKRNSLNVSSSQQ
jgi:hypothetical protein